MLCRTLCTEAAALVFGDFDYQRLASDAYYVLATDFVTASTKSLRGAVVAGSGRQMTFLQVQPFDRIEDSTISDVVFVYDAQFCNAIVKSCLRNVVLQGAVVAEVVEASYLVGIAAENFLIYRLSNATLCFVDFGYFKVSRAENVRIDSGVLRNIEIASAKAFYGQDLLLPAGAVFSDCANCLPADYVQIFAKNCRSCSLSGQIVRFTTKPGANQTALRPISMHLAALRFECSYFSFDGCLEFCGLPGPVCNNRGTCRGFACYCDAGWSPRTNCLARAARVQANYANATLAFLTAIFVCVSFACFGLVIHMRIVSARYAKRAAAEQRVRDGHARMRALCQDE